MPLAQSAKDEAGHVAGTAKEQAGQIVETAGHAAGSVTTTAKEQASEVVGQAVGQAQSLLSQATEQLSTQASEQAQRLAGNVRQLAQQLTNMAEAGDQGTPAHSLVARLADKGHDVAGYLEQHEPGRMVSDLQAFGRRRPGAFLLGAAVAGFVAGRLGKAAKSASSSRAQPPQPAEPTLTTPLGDEATLPPAPVGQTLAGRSYGVGEPVATDPAVSGTPALDPYPTTGSAREIP